MSLPILEPKPLPLGSPSYEAVRQGLIKSLSDSIPSSLHVSESLLTSSKNVTQVPRLSGILTESELDITESYDAVGIAEAIRSRKLTSAEAVAAFAKRAAIAHQLTSCLTEWFMDEALERAKELDKILGETGKPVGPLHGVPVSIKVHLPMKGHTSSKGFVSTIQKDTYDCHSVKILREAGAVFYCKTNQPQVIMHLESDSVFGRVLNPYNINLTAGGSSGGEAALLAMHGSVMGIGSDIGGSIRQPAAVCGIYGFKPTGNLFPHMEALPGGASSELNIPACSGPMCVSLRDVDFCMKVFMDTKPWLEDPILTPTSWKGLQKGDGVKIGIMMDDGAIMPQPPVTKALKWATEKLDAAGIKWKKFEVENAAQATKNIHKAYFPSGVAGVKGLLDDAGEPSLELTEYLLHDVDLLDVNGVYAMQLERNEYRRAFIRKWEDQDVDVIICPSFVGPAAAHDTAKYWNYTSLWNYLDCPGLVFPTPIVADSSKEDYQGFDTKQCKEVRRFWKEGDFEGAPINLQVVARRYHDNQIFEALEQVKDIFGLK